MEDLTHTHTSSLERSDRQIKRRQRDKDMLLIRLSEEFSINEFTREDVKNTLGAFAKSTSGKDTGTAAALTNLIKEGLVNDDNGSLMISHIGQIIIENADEDEENNMYQ